MYKIAGIDYSLTCPAITILFDNSNLFVNSKVYHRANSKKYTGIFQNITGEIPQEYTDDMGRYTNAANWALNIVKDCDLIFLEGYSYGSMSGMIFNIAEATGILKHILHQNKLKVETIAPTVIKKFATGKGNSDKSQMYEAFKKDQGIDLVKLLSFEKKISSPLTDIVDSYYIAKYAFNQLKNFKEI